MIETWQSQIIRATQDGKPLDLRGGDSKRFYGSPSPGRQLELAAFSGIVSYEPTELVVTARCGTSLAELESLLAKQGQMLPFEPPHFGRATVGGCVAAGLSGPRRVREGAVRDFVLGAKLLDGTGNHHTFGGQVMKNVAGYDVSRLLVGSLGTLGIITEVSLKVLPVPKSEVTLQQECKQDEALHKLCVWSQSSLPLSATAWTNNVLSIRLSGAESAVQQATASLGGESLDNESAAFFWQNVREQRLPFFEANDAVLWRLALPVGTPSFNEVTLLEWHGTQRWLYAAPDSDSPREFATARGGHATRFRSPPGIQQVREREIFTLQPEPVMRLQRRLKQQFDPCGIFNPGRLYRFIDAVS